MKLCPFCDTVLDDKCWCSKCQRTVILYKEISDNQGWNDTSNNASNDNANNINNTSDDIPNDTRDDNSIYNYADHHEEQHRFDYVEPARKAAPTPQQKKSASGDVVKWIAVFVYVCLIIAMAVLTSQNRRNASKKVDYSIDMGTYTYDADEVLKNMQMNLDAASEMLIQFAPSVSWEEMINLPNINVESYGDNMWYYYSDDVIKELGKQCDFYHIPVYREVIEQMFKEYYESNVSVDAYADEYDNLYAQGSDWYYTIFQKGISYNDNRVESYINFDTATEAVHYIAFSGVNPEFGSALISQVLTRVSKAYAGDEESMFNLIYDAKKGLEANDAKVIYEDSNVALLIENDTDVYSVQIVTSQYVKELETDQLGYIKTK